jgi:hypothetical protein
MLASHSDNCPALHRSPMVEAHRRWGPVGHDCSLRPLPMEPRISPCPFLRQASPALFLGRASKICLQYKFSNQHCLEIKKHNRGNKTFFFQLQIEFIYYSLKGSTLFHLIQKIQKIINIFDDVRVYLNFQKTHFGTLVL